MVNCEPPRDVISIVDFDLIKPDQPLAGNYVEPEVFQIAYATIHPRKSELTHGGDLASNPFAGGVQHSGIGSRECRRYLQQVNGGVTYS